MHKRTVTLGTLAMLLLCSFWGCADTGISRPPWLNSLWPSPPAPYSTTSSYRHHRSNERVRSARRYRAPRESSATASVNPSASPKVDNVSTDRTTPPVAVSRPTPVSLTLAGDSGDRERAQQLLANANENLTRARAQRLTAAQKATYERASQLASRARRALADNDCAAASSLAGKASSLAAGINNRE